MLIAKKLLYVTLVLMCVLLFIEGIIVGVGNLLIIRAGDDYHQGGKEILQSYLTSRNFTFNESALYEILRHGGEAASLDIAKKLPYLYGDRLRRVLSALKNERDIRVLPDLVAKRKEFEESNEIEDKRWRIRIDQVILYIQGVDVGSLTLHRISSVSVPSRGKLVIQYDDGIVDYFIEGNKVSDKEFSYQDDYLSKEDHN